MSEHTPGPWTSILRKHPSQSEGEYFVMGQNDHGIAMLLDYSPADEMRANAALISAAPDLLVALKECLDAELARRQKLLPGAPATTYCEARIARIRAAIAKAEGRNNG